MPFSLRHVFLLVASLLCVNVVYNSIASLSSDSAKLNTSLLPQVKHLVKRPRTEEESSARAEEQSIATATTVRASGDHPVTTINVTAIPCLTHLTRTLLNAAAISTRHVVPFETGYETNWPKYGS
ncbi:hypothetical protein TrST_g11239, partial [Triparma strigata]